MASWMAEVTEQCRESKWVVEGDSRKPLASERPQPLPDESSSCETAHASELEG